MDRQLQSSNIKMRYYLGFGLYLYTTPISYLPFLVGFLYNTNIEWILGIFIELYIFADLMRFPNKSHRNVDVMKWFLFIIIIINVVVLRFMSGDGCIIIECDA